MPQVIQLLHLSDIHFRRGHTGGVHDLDHDIRNELVRDVAKLRNDLGLFTATVVTGDIAFAGKREEYEYADEWLRDVGRAAGVPEELVWSTPGNHDVDRSIVDNEDLILVVHNRLRECPNESLDEEIRKFFDKSAIARELLFRPFAEYNRFATKFGCALTPEKPFWQQRLILNDGSSLMVRGLNSTLVSDARDNDLTHKLVLGAFQSVCPREDGVAYLTLCHHPPDWLRDGEEVEANLNARVAVQLFGHKHKHRVRRVDESLCLTAGATHPSRVESRWQPRYNAIALVVTNTAEGTRQLSVSIYPRVWSDETKQFVPDAQFHGRTYNLPMPTWSPPTTNASGNETLPFDPAGNAATAIQVENREMDKARRLAYRFLTLPYHKQMEVAQKLALISDEDRGVSDDILFSRFFQRARDRGLLRELWTNVELGHNAPESPNPFGEENKGAT